MRYAAILSPCACSSSSAGFGYGLAGLLFLAAVTLLEYCPAATPGEPGLPQPKVYQVCTFRPDVSTLHHDVITVTPLADSESNSSHFFSPGLVDFSWLFF